MITNTQQFTGNPPYWIPSYSPVSQGAGEVVGLPGSWVAPWDWDGPNDEIRRRFFYGARRGDPGAHRVDNARAEFAERRCAATARRSGDGVR
jgi:hypothetical protein